MSFDPRLVRRLKVAAPSAAMVTDPVAGGMAERARLAKGDVLLNVAGEAIRGVDDLHRLLTGDRADTELTVQTLRAGQLLNRTVVPEPDG